MGAIRDKFDEYVGNNWGADKFSSFFNVIAYIKGGIDGWQKHMWEIRSKTAEAISSLEEAITGALDGLKNKLDKGEGLVATSAKVLEDLINVNKGKIASNETTGTTNRALIQEIDHNKAEDGGTSEEYNSLKKVEDKVKENTANISSAVKIFGTDANTERTNSPFVLRLAALGTTSVNYFVYLFDISDDGYISANIVGVGDIGTYQGHGVFKLGISARRQDFKGFLKNVDNISSHPRNQEIYYKFESGLCKVYMKYPSETTATYPYPPTINVIGCRYVTIKNSVVSGTPSGLIKIPLT